MPLRFSKVHGTGNDYVVVNTADGSADWPVVARTVCRRRLGVGADGLVVISHRGGARFTVRCLNPDGSGWATSGNALRCSALTIQRQYGYRTSTLWMCGEQHRAEIGPAGIGVAFPAVGAVRGPVQTQAGPAWSVWVGGEHVVVPVPAVDAVPVQALGARLRRDPRLGMSGVNVAFVQAVADRHALRLRSYERGVDRETLSSGTGAIAAALVARALGLAPDADRPLPVEMAGGTLTVSGRPPTEVWLHGAATVVFDGKMDWPAATAEAPSVSAALCAAR